MCFLRSQLCHLHHLLPQDLKLQILSRNVEDCPPVITADLLQGMQEKTVREDTVASLQETTQREVSLAVDISNHQKLTSAISEQGSTRDKARMGSLGLPNAGAWLNVIPSPALGLHLQPAEFVTAIKYRLGMRIFAAEGKCAACPGLSDTAGDHAVSCA